MEFLKKINIADEDIIDAICTALEGGSNHWYNTKVDIKTLGRPDEAPSERLVKAALYDNALIDIYDLVEPDEKLGVLSLETIKRGISMYLDNNSSFEADMDAGEADDLFQYIVMGELVFG